MDDELKLGLGTKEVGDPEPADYIIYPGEQASA